jgi:leucyl/phenylalanyl-tRNA---protein transferase
MSTMSSAPIEITPEILLRAYACGIFPMAESADDPVLHWVEPARRGVLPLDRFSIPGRLGRTVRSDRFEVVINRDFGGVLDGCAAPAAGRERTWINHTIRQLFCALNEAGRAHSVEVYREGRLVGGLYGLALGAAFFGESMFHTERDASKVALVHLVARLRIGRFQLLDTQFLTGHLAQFGAHEVTRKAYGGMLDAALEREADFLCAGLQPLAGRAAFEAAVA